MRVVPPPPPEPSEVELRVNESALGELDRVGRQWDERIARQRVQNIWQTAIALACLVFAIASWIGALR